MALLPYPRGGVPLRCSSECQPGQAQNGPGGLWSRISALHTALESLVGRVAQGKPQGSCLSAPVPPGLSLVG